MSKVQCTGLSLTIRNTKILQDIDLSLEDGKIYGIVGRNGSGKTMLMKCICGLIAPTKGQIFVDGKEIGRDMDFPPSVGIIIEMPGFLPYQSGWRNLKHLAALNQKIGNAEIAAAMKLVGLSPALRKPVGKYSLGMRQRLGIAQAIMEDPELLILDEPFNGLDQEGVDEMRALFLRLKEQGKTILLSSHHAEDIEILCDRVYRMDRGMMVERQSQ